MKARAVKSFPIGKEWMYEPKWDGFRCLIFRDEENIFLQSRTGKSLTSAFPEIVAAFRALRPKRFVLDGELALPTEDGFSFDGLVNRLRIGSARLALEVRDSPAIYVVFNMLADAASLPDLPFRLRRKTLEQRTFLSSLCTMRSLGGIGDGVPLLVQPTVTKLQIPFCCCVPGLEAIRQRTER
jgi:ATP-dependent DNA ligase